MSVCTIAESLILASNVIIYIYIYYVYIHVYIYVRVFLFFYYYFSIRHTIVMVYHIWMSDVSDERRSSKYHGTC